MGTMEMEELAKYSDVITRENIDEKFISSIPQQLDLNFSDWNATSVGNAAYVALHSKSESHTGYSPSVEYLRCSKKAATSAST